MPWNSYPFWQNFHNPILDKVVVHIHGCMEEENESAEEFQLQSRRDGQYLYPGGFNLPRATIAKESQFLRASGVSARPTQPTYR